MIKADKETAVTELTKLFRKVWEEEKIPDKKWKKGVIVKLHKKGDIRECSINWRGVTLLTVPSKLFGRIIINRITNAVDEVLRKITGWIPTGARYHRVDYIFIPRNILKQACEWSAPSLYAHFVDFEKAFDFVHRSNLWIIMKAYGIPEKVLNLIKVMYEDFECEVVDEGELTGWFKITYVGVSYSPCS